MVTTIRQQTGWKRGPMAVSVCQDSDILARVYEFDFDLHDVDFVRYYVARTGDDILDAKCGWKKMREILLMDSDGIPASLHEERSHRITKGKLQDCWELYKERGGHLPGEGPFES